MARRIDPRRRGVVAAAVTAAAVLVVVLVQEVLVALAGILSGLSFPGQADLVISTTLQGAWTTSTTSSLPFAVGVFLSLWQLAPIAGILQIGHVLARAVLASGIGALATLVVTMTVGIWRLFDAGYDPSIVGSGAMYLGIEFSAALRVAVTTFVTAVPLVALAGILLWIWSRDRDRDVSGMLDL